jgi:zinc/manganese transport system ATP-binding protein
MTRSSPPLLHHSLHVHHACAKAHGASVASDSIATSQASACVSFSNVTLGYDHHPAVHHLTGSIPHGALMAIAGPNGAGKSTLLKSLVGALSPLEGQIVADVKAHDIAYLPQSAEINRSFPIRVDDFVMMGLWRQIGVWRGLTSAHKDRVHMALASVGLSGFEARTIGTLSGGQMQRAMFARLLLQDAKLILLDEPFTAIDAKTTRDLLDLVQRWHGEKRTVIAVLHDMDLITRIFPDTLLLAREVIAWGNTQETLRPENLLKARRMVEAFDHHAPICERSAA